MAGRQDDFEKPRQRGTRMDECSVVVENGESFFCIAFNTNHGSSRSRSFVSSSSLIPTCMLGHIVYS